MMQPFTHCPSCGKKGVQFHFGLLPGEDNYSCRYCDFFFFFTGGMSVDRDNETRWRTWNAEIARMRNVPDPVKAADL